MKLDKKAIALASAIFWGFSVFLTTIWIIIIGSGGETLQKLDRFYFGYSVTIPGAFIGLVYGLIDGFICGWIFAWLYNRFVKQ